MKLKRRPAILNLQNETVARKSAAPVSTRIRRKCVNLALTTRTMGDVAVVHCGGSLVFQKEAAALCDLVSDLVKRYRSVVLDLNEVSAIDGGGLGVLADCIRNSREAGARLVLCRVPHKVRAVLDLTRISSLVDIAGSERDALIRTGAAA
jgi:anti-anti-sigma factor